MGSDAGSSSGTPSKSKGKGKAKAAAPALDKIVELKNGKLSLLQKPIVLEHNKHVRERLVKLGEYMEKKADEEMDTFPKRHLAVLGMLVQEQTKDAADLARTLEPILFPSVDEESQSTRYKVSRKGVREAIKQIAERKNYGLELTDLNLDDEDEIDSVPNHLAIWRWELNDRDEYFPSELVGKFDERYEARQSAHDDALELINALPEAERLKILSGVKGKKAKKGGGGKDEAIDLDGDGDEAKPKKSRKKKVDSDDEEAVAEAEAKAVKKAANAEKKAEREAKKAAKEEKTQKAEAIAKKSAGAMSAFLAKKPAVKPVPVSSSTPAKARAASPVAGPSRGASSSPQIVQKPTLAPAAAPATIATPASIGPSPFERVFRPFVARKHTELAPEHLFNRRPIIIDLDTSSSPCTSSSSSTGASDESRSLELDSRSDLTVAEVIAEMTADASRRPSYTYHRRPQPVSVRELMRQISESELLSTGGRKWRDILMDPKKVPIKLLKFHDDRRHGYVGTWTKTSTVIGPRTPMMADTSLLNYEYDSDEDWESDGEGEEIDSNAGGDEEEGDDVPESDEDSFIDDGVTMQDGYDAEGGPIDVDDPDAAPLVKKRPATDDLAAAKKKRVKHGKLVPVCLGVSYQSDLAEPALGKDDRFFIQFLGNGSFFGQPLSLDLKVAPIVLTGSSSGADASLKPASGPQRTQKKGKRATLTTAGASGTDADDSGAEVKKGGKAAYCFPDSSIPEFIRTVEASQCTSKPDLVRELVEVFPDSTKGMLERMTSQYTSKKKCKGVVVWTCSPKVCSVPA